MRLWFSRFQLRLSGKQFDLLAFVFKVTRVGTTINCDIMVIYLRSTKNDMTYIHGDNVTPYLVLIGTELNGD